jgi:hypothetical protein
MHDDNLFVQKFTALKIILGKHLDHKYTFLIPVFVGTLILTGLILLWPAANVDAQCGSQASSCKNCHEVQAQKPVNNDGTSWHQSHAFGDFCYICHGGNQQSMDKDTAHAGMTDPMSDVKLACQSCHPNDLTARAQVYATALGVKIGTGGDNTPPAGNNSGGSGSSSASQPSASSSSGASDLSAPAGMVVDTQNVIDYNQRYEGKSPVNWGNVIVGILIVLVLLGGGAFVFFNERKLRGLSTGPQVKPTAQKESPILPEIEGYSQEVVALLPKIAQLNPMGLYALKRLLENPEEASELLHSLSRLDPELVRRIRSLDREARAVLLALAGD